MDSQYEREFQLPVSLHHEFLLDSGDVLYRGTIHHLKFDDPNELQGCAILERYYLTNSIPSAVRTFASKLFGIKAPPPRKVWALEWSLDTHGEAMTHWRSRVLYQGEPCSVSRYSQGVRGKLVALAANRGFVITDDLLDKVFMDIERKLKEYSGAIAAARRKEV